MGAAFVLLSHTLDDVGEEARGCEVRQSRPGLEARFHHLPAE